MVKALLLDKKNQSPAPTPSTTPALVKAVESNCVTCGGAHSYQNCPATHENAYQNNIQEYVSQAVAANYNQGNTGFRPQMVANQIRPPGFPPHQNNQNNFNRGNNFNQNRGGNFNQSNINPSSFIKANLIDLRDVSFKVGVFHFPADFVVDDFEPDPRVPLILGRCFLKTSRALIDVHKGELTLCIGNEVITYNLDQTVRYSANYNQMTAKKIDVVESACKEYSQEVLGFSNVTASGTPTPQ
nr:reverse transcriptase domain-containing protein [Tanacetum cinerariifolium]